VNIERPGAGSLGRNTLWMGAGQAIRTGVQALYFVLIARALGVEGYGAFVSVVALVGIVAPFAGWGTGMLLIKNVSRSPGSFRRQWGRAIASILLSGTILLLLAAAAARLFLPRTIPVVLVVVVGASDLLFARLVDLSGQAHQAIQRMHRTAQVQLLLSLLRLGAAVVLIAALSSPTALEWGQLYLVSSAVAASAAVYMVNRELGMPEFSLRHLGDELKDGAFFSVSLSAQTIYNDIDKAMLARLSTLEATGIYAAAYRLVDAAFLPVASLITSSYARFFQHGVDGMRATTRLAVKLARPASAYGILVGIALYLIGPYLPLVIGEEYRGVAAAVRWLAVLPVLKSVHYFGANALTGAGYQGLRTSIQLGVALFNVLLNLWLIPRYSWHGAAAASIASDGLLAVAIWGMVWELGRRSSIQRPHVRQPSAAVGTQ
jgi:O-antigen/teichoic acid export membrane protein